MWLVVGGSIRSQVKGGKEIGRSLLYNTYAGGNRVRGKFQEKIGGVGVVIRKFELSNRRRRIIFEGP